jgi:hypothetical protein
MLYALSVGEAFRMVVDVAQKSLAMIEKAQL